MPINAGNAQSINTNIITGQKMYIIGFRGEKDIDVAFEDGTIIYHTTYAKFKKGKV